MSLWLRIKNVKNMTVKRDFPSINPVSRHYLTFWREQKRRVIEGFWAVDTQDVTVDILNDKSVKAAISNPKSKGNWRYMPSNLYFYVNIATILHRPKGMPKTSPKIVIRPYLRDFEWEFFYNWAECRGFSGFMEDNDYSCNRMLLQKGVTDDELISEAKDINGEIVDTIYNNFFNSNGERKEYIAAREYLRKLHDKPLGLALFNNEAQDLMLIGSRGGGKMQPLSSSVLTPAGKSTMGKISVGDTVIGSNGKPCKVLNKFPQGVQDVYTVHLQDGRKIRAGLDHLWKVITFGKEKVLTTKEILDKGVYIINPKRGDKTFKFAIENTKPVEYNKKALGINPYVLGVLLGDGAIVGSTPRLASSDDFIVDEFKKVYPNFKIERDLTTTNNWTLVDTDKKASKYSKKDYVVNKLTDEIKHLGVNKSCKYKFIPKEYKQGSIQQRLELLQGLMDTDGSINTSGSIEFTNTNKTLAKDVMEVARSLGIQARWGVDDRSDQLHKIKGHECYRSITYRVYLKTDLPIFRLPRKLERIQKLKRANKVSIIDIVKEDYKEEQACIMVDSPDNTYLTTDYTVTHNSFIGGVGVALHEIITNGVKYYTQESIAKPPLAEVFVGAAMSSKTKDMLSKTESAMQNLGGGWKIGSEEEVPSPLYKEMKGQLLKSGSKWEHRYDKKINGKWKEVGSFSYIKHGTFTVENPEAAAGGRYSVIVVEEVGLIPNMLTIYGSNSATQMTDGTIKYGSTLMQGTSGNLDKIVETEILFMGPEGFDILPFDDEWENTGKIGFFLPATHVDGTFKDENGNTKEEEALAHYLARRKKKATASSSTALELEKYNYPLKPSEMFSAPSSNNFPVSDLKHRLAEIMADKDLLAASDKGFYKLNEDGSVTFKNEPDAIVLRNFPITKSDAKKINLKGAGERFEPPKRDDEGNIPYGRYIASQDPVDDDGNDITGEMLSLQSFFILDTFTDRLVFEYTGRTRLAKDFYEQCRRALIDYNALLLYENNKKGLFAHFDAKSSLYLLADTPSMLRDMDLQKGTTGGNKSKGVYATPKVKQLGMDLILTWLVSQAPNKEDGVSNLQTIRSPGLLLELIKYHPKLNTDRISTLIILMIYKKSVERIITKRKEKINTLANDPLWDLIN